MVSPFRKILKGKNKNTLTPKEEGFCHDYLDTGNGAEAVRRNYDVSNPKISTPRVMANQILNRPMVQSFLEGAAMGAVTRIETLSKNAKNESVKLSANKDILDRAGFQAVTRSDITTLGDKLNLIPYSDEQIKRAASEIVRQSNPDMHYTPGTPEQSGRNESDAGTKSQE